MIMDFINSLTFGQFMLLELYCVFVALFILFILFIACGLIFLLFSFIVSRIFGIDTFDVLEFGRICKESDHSGSWLLFKVRDVIKDYDGEED